MFRWEHYLIAFLSSHRVTVATSWIQGWVSTGFQNPMNQGRQVGGATRVKPIQNLSVELLDLPVKVCWVWSMNRKSHFWHATTHNLSTARSLYPKILSKWDYSKVAVDKTGQWLCFILRTLSFVLVSGQQTVPGSGCSAMIVDGHAW
jgi:hypothetical protein